MHFFGPNALFRICHKFIFNIANTCSSTAGGQIETPNYPSNYNNNADITFPLEVATGYFIKLTFHTFDIEAHSRCGFDYVQVLDTDGSELAKLCGNSLPTPLTSSGNKMTVVFHSDYSVTRPGFSASWEVAEASGITFNYLSVTL